MCWLAKGASSSLRHTTGSLCSALRASARIGRLTLTKKSCMQPRNTRCVGCNDLLLVARCKWWMHHDVPRSFLLLWLLSPCHYAYMSLQLCTAGARHASHDAGSIIDLQTMLHNINSCAECRPRDQPSQPMLLFLPWPQSPSLGYVWLHTGLDSHELTACAMSKTGAR